MGSTSKLDAEPAGPSRRQPWADLVDSHIGLALSLGRRWARRPGDQQDVTQVALLGLVRAARGYDDGKGTAFSTFAFATITGDIRRYYRDATWTVHVPRGMQEDYLAVAAARELLTHELSRSPTFAELAEFTGIPEERVIEATEARHAYDVKSFDEPMTTRGDGARPGGDGSSWSPGVAEPGYVGVERRQEVDALLARLPSREREIVRLRFFEDRSQLEIARQLGVSQMHISRLLRRSLDRLRAIATEGAGGGDSGGGARAVQTSA